MRRVKVLLNLHVGHSRHKGQAAAAPPKYIGENRVASPVPPMRSSDIVPSRIAR
jgi:hypothetical protein